MSSTAASGVVRLRVICGPTAVGKSALAVRLAGAVGGAIVTADSRQVYCGFDIGTAKPTAAELACVPHFGIDLVDPTARYSAAAWAAEVPGWLEHCQTAGRTPVVVGGTGFYIRALFDPLFEAPPLDAERRAQFHAFAKVLSVEELRRWCSMLDPARAHLGRTQLLRAIETSLFSGSRLSDLATARSRAPLHDARYLLLDPGPALSDRIARRVDAMFAAGWLQEVRDLASRVPAGAPAWTATGYEVVRQVVAGERTLEEARDIIVTRTRQYAKRQRTWFRHQLPSRKTLAVDPGEPDTFARALAWWNGIDQ